MKTRDGTEVIGGQLWRDLDKRMNRTVRVLQVIPPHAFVENVCNGRRVQIRVDRMHEHGTGFALVEE